MKNEALRNNISRKEKAHGLKRAVCELLNWTELQYGEYVFERGTEYLHVYLQGDEYAIQVLERSPIFWAWWKNHFAKRDESFLMLHRSTPIRSLEIRLQLYHHYNEPKMLAESIHPNSVVLNESYALMIKEVITHETRHHEKA